jgi:hypothetical protein
MTTTGVAAAVVAMREGERDPGLAHFRHLSSLGDKLISIVVIAKARESKVAKALVVASKAAL